jgi:uncharacterized delta-60 repeat protein
MNSSVGSAHASSMVRGAAVPHTDTPITSARRATRWRRITGVGIAAVTLALAGGPLASAAPGDLDTSFSGDGTVPVVRGQRQLPVAGLSSVVQADGSILTIGATETALTSGVITRLRADGSVDRSFGVDGRSLLNVRPITYPTAAIRQGDSTVIVGIATTSLLTSEYDIFVVRLTASGKRDTTFGPRGVRILDVDAFDAAWSVAAGPSGSLFVAGAMGTDAAVVKLTSNGTLDTGFGTGGVQRIATGLSDPFELRPDVAATPAGGAVVVFTDLGYAPTPATRLVRLTAAGLPDTGFGGTGEVIEDVSVETEFGKEVLVAGGRIFAVTQLESDAWITAFADDGSVDTSWATSGKRLVPMDGTTPTVEDAIIDGAGRIVIAGSAVMGGTTMMQAVRVGATGVLDTAFAGDGTFVGVQVRSPGATSISRRGTGYVLSGASDAGLITTALRADGTRASSFGSNGVRRVRVVSSSQVQMRDVLIEPNKRVVALAGTMNKKGEEELTLLRYRRSGTPDPTFGNGGVVTMAIAGSDVSPDAVRRDASGRYVVSMVVADGSRHFTVLARFTPSGQPDTSFGPNGRRILVPGLLDTSAPTRLALDDVGRAVVATQLNDEIVVVARVRPNGTPDPTFGEGGAIVVDRALSNAWQFRQMAVLSSGRIALADMGARRIVHLRSDGSLDAGYGPGGARDIALDASYANSTISFRADGSFVVAHSAPGGDTRIARMASDASLDGAFGAGGVLTIPGTPATSLSVTRTVLRSDGSVVLVGVRGSTSLPISKLSTALGVVTSAGALDPTFSGDGIAVVDLARKRADLPVALSVRGRRAVVAAAVIGDNDRGVIARVEL